MLDDMLRKIGVITGIIHVGANVGQEIESYAALTDGPIVLIEPIDEVFEQLCANIGERKNFFPVKAVCTDRDGDHVTFNVSSNAGESSSILDLGRHGQMYPQVTYVRQIEMVTYRLDTLIASMDLHPMPNLLVMDTQGSELTVLRGAHDILPEMDGVHTEAASNPLYEGGCTLDQLSVLLREYGLPILWAEMHEGQEWGSAFFLRTHRKTIAQRRLETLPTYGGNLARGKPTVTSSEYTVTGSDSRSASDGKITGTFAFHTAHEQEPWWMVDLEIQQVIEEIRVFNRVDMCSDRANSLEVLISSSDGSWTLVHRQEGKPFGGVDGNPLRVMVGGRPARYVRLRLAQADYLHLDAVEVY